VEAGRVRVTADLVGWIAALLKELRLIMLRAPTQAVQLQITPPKHPGPQQRASCMQCVGAGGILCRSLVAGACISWNNQLSALIAVGKACAMQEPAWRAA